MDKWHSCLFAWVRLLQMVSKMFSQEIRYGSELRDTSVYTQISADNIPLSQYLFLLMALIQVSLFLV